MARTLPPLPRKPPPRSRAHRRRLLLALLGGTVLVVALGVVVWHRVARPHAVVAELAGAEIPAPDLTGADPAVSAALTQAREAVRETQDSAKAWGHFGMVLSAHSYAAEANACFVRAEALAARDPRWPYYQGTELCQNDPEVAIAKLQRAVQFLGERAEVARLRLAELLLRQGRLDEAEQQLAEVLRQSPENARARLNSARVARERGNLSGSLEALRGPLTDPRTQKAAHLLAAEVQRRLGHDAAATQARQRAAQLPKDLDWPDPFVEEIMRLRTGRQVRLALAAGLISQGRSREAATALRQMVKDYPDSDWAWVLWGRALIAEKELPAAETALRKAVGLAPASMEAQFYLGVVLLLAERPAEAADCFRRATAIKPDFAEGHHNLAHCLLRQGDPTGALAAFRTALNCKPNYPEAHLDLGDLLSQRGQKEEALLHLREAAQLNPKSVRARQLLEQVQKQISSAP